MNKMQPGERLKFIFVDPPLNCNVKGGETEVVKDGGGMALWSRLGQGLEGVESSAADNKV